MEDMCDTNSGQDSRSDQALALELRALKSIVASESSVGEVGEKIPSSSDEEGCIDMMRVENKRCQVLDAFCVVPPMAPRPRPASQQPRPNRGNEKARVSRHVRPPHFN